MEILNILLDIKNQFNAVNEEINKAHSIKKVIVIYDDFLEGQGLFMSSFKKIRNLKVNFKDTSKEELISFNKSKGEAIQVVNSLKESLNKCKNQKIEELTFEDLKIIAKKQSIHQEYISGSIHPVTAEMWNIKKIFSNMGFTSYDAPDIDCDKTNFLDLNIPENHPSRSMHDTFYIDDANLNTDKQFLLRTHTSNAQIRFLKKYGAKPARVLSAGRVYRSDHDSTHSPMFHQVEGFCTGEVNFANLKYCLNKLLRDFFEVDNLKTRFRPSYFPFTEPSVEVDVAYDIVDGKLVLNGNKWLEVLGAGMINKKVFQNCGITENIRGFAFGLGLTRFVMLKHNIPSLNFYGSTDNRWLRHFNNLNR